MPLNEAVPPPERRMNEWLLAQASGGPDTPPGNPRGVVLWDSPQGILTVEFADQGFRLFASRDGASFPVSPTPVHAAVWSGSGREITVPMLDIEGRALIGRIDLATDPKVDFFEIHNGPSTLVVRSEQEGELMRFDLPPAPRGIFVQLILLSQVPVGTA